MLSVQMYTHRAGRSSHDNEINDIEMVYALLYYQLVQVSTLGDWINILYIIACIIKNMRNRQHIAICVIPTGLPLNWNILYYTAVICAGPKKWQNCGILQNSLSLPAIIKEQNVFPHELFEVKKAGQQLNTFELIGAENVSILQHKITNV